MSDILISREVFQIVDSERVQVAPGFFVRRPMPSQELDMIDPWLMLDHFGPTVIAPGEASGVPDHPHRGFQPITYLIDGAIEHRDSAGNHVVVRAGEINWMTAGSGIIHSELPPDDFKKSGGRMHGFQIWMNLPRNEKMSAPGIQHIAAGHVPVVLIGSTRIKIIAGDLNGVRSAVSTKSPATFFHCTIPAGENVLVPVHDDQNIFAYIAEGKGWAGEAHEKISDGQLVQFKTSGNAVALGADAGASLEALVIGGVPLNEPVFSYGPFVMNTKQEIVDAIEDYKQGKF